MVDGQESFPGRMHKTFLVTAVSITCVRPIHPCPQSVSRIKDNWTTETVRTRLSGFHSTQRRCDSHIYRKVQDDCGTDSGFRTRSLGVKAAEREAK